MKRKKKRGGRERGGFSSEEFSRYLACKGGGQEVKVAGGRHGSGQRAGGNHCADERHSRKGNGVGSGREKRRGRLRKGC